MLVRTIKTLFQRYPRLSNSVVYGSLYVGAELSQQVVTRKLMVKNSNVESLDFKALGRYVIMGSVINSNLLYTWYKWLDKRFTGTQYKIIIKKVLLDQFLMTPPLYLVFFVSMNLMEGRTDFFQECKEKFPKTFAISCLFWLPAQCVNFLYVPNQARVVYIGLCSFIWVNVLCWIKRSNIKSNSNDNASVMSSKEN
ncbi:hypothetical protein RUM43_000764 [Polyplax serrata]|uniref:Mpv17-like protein n=1 Tax=Polyplax serrata TaxID=468196 RepID=A0AAN8SGK5_POLSC